MKRRDTKAARGARSGRRGSALVLAILILFAMLALGLLAMRSATRNIASSGNLRLGKQARYVAELGLYHAMSLMQQSGYQILRFRASSDPTSTSVLEIESAVDGMSQVLIRKADGSEGPKMTLPAPTLLGADSLGQFTGLVPSYRVVVDGFQAVPSIAGTDLEEMGATAQGFCEMQFTSRGFIAEMVLPTEADLSAQGAERFAESTIKAAAPLGPVDLINCRRL